jgi:hypothetical protein
MLLCTLQNPHNDVKQTAATNKVEAHGLEGDKFVEISGHDGDVKRMVGVDGGESEEVERGGE